MNQRPGQAKSLLHAHGKTVHEKFSLILQLYLLQQKTAPFPGHQSLYSIA